jgi:hypothetical protein
MGSKKSGNARGNPIYGAEQKEEIVAKYADLLETDTDTCITQLALTAGANYGTIDRWEECEPAIHRRLNMSRKVRAWKYITKSLHVLRDCDPFYDTGTNAGRKDSNALVNLARFRSEAYRNVAGFLVPEVFGNYSHELKALSKEIKELQKTLVKDQVAALPGAT